MKEYIVVDSNIIFSAFLNIDSNISKIILRNNNYNFVSPTYAIDEILKYKHKIMNIGKLTEIKFIDIYNLIFKKIILIDNKNIPKDKYHQSIELCSDIDINDITFVAFALHFNCNLWTGDKKLINGLLHKGYKNIITTNELKILSGLR